MSKVLYLPTYLVTNPMFRVMRLGWLVVFGFVYSLAHVQPQTYASCVRIFLFEVRFWAPYINNYLRWWYISRLWSVNSSIQMV